MNKTKILHISADDALLMFQGKQTLKPGLLPEGYRTLAVASDFVRDGISFKIEHDSFEEVPPREIPPTIVAEFAGVPTLRIEYPVSKNSFTANSLGDFVYIKTPLSTGLHQGFCGDFQYVEVNIDDMPDQELVPVPTGQKLDFGPSVAKDIFSLFYDTYRVEIADDQVGDELNTGDTQPDEPVIVEEERKINFREFL